MLRPIDENLIETLKIESLRLLYPELNEVLKVSESFSRFVFLVNHFINLHRLDELKLTGTEK